MYKNLAEKLKSARLSTGLTRKQVAERIGISYAVLAHYETGEREPSLNVLYSLAKLYKVSVDFLLDVTVSTSNTIVLDGLNDNQKQIVKDTVNYFRNSIHE